MKPFATTVSATLKLSLALCLSLSWMGAQAAETRIKPFNRIVVVVDASGSYLRRQNEAIAKTGQLLAGLSARKVKRWEQADEIKIISLDAMPEVIWEGTPEKLSRTGATEWAARFKARKDYANCTDVTAALELAATLLEADPKPTEKYLFAFSDFVHEPPKGTLGKCQAHRLPSVPGKDFAWDRFAEVKIAVLWMPPAQKLAWDREMKEQGLTSYRLLTTSESASAELDIPAPARRKVTEAERQKGRETLLAAWDYMLIAVAALMALLVSGVGAAVVAQRFRRWKMTKPAPGARVVNGPVAPMRIPRNPN